MNTENYDAWALSIFKSVESDGLPERIPGRKISRYCVCYCPPKNPKEVGKYVISWYSYETGCWEGCYDGKIEPSKYLELPMPWMQLKEYDVHLQTRSTNCFPEIPDGVYQGKMGGRVAMLEYQEKVYNFTFLKGITGYNIPKTLTIISGWAWTMLRDGPIIPGMTGK